MGLRSQPVKNFRSFSPSVERPELTAQAEDGQQTKEGW